MVRPPVDLRDIRHYFGETMGFPQVDVLIKIISGGVPHR